MVKTKKRYAIIAFLLSYIFPGIGYIYIGMPKKAIFFLVSLFFTLFLTVLLTLLLGKIGTLLCLTILILLYLHNLLFPAYTAYKIQNFAPTRFNSIRYYVAYIILFILSLIAFVTFFSQNFRIPAASMQNTLLIGDHISSKKFAYGISTPHIPFLEIPLILGTDGHILDGDEPERGDIVIFRYPNNTQLHYIKRCVALPGDELFLQDKVLYLHPREGDEYAKKMFAGYELVEVEGKLWIKNPYAKEHPGIHNDEKMIDNGIFPTELFNVAPIQVPEGEYFMMGDNRDHSNDSRFWGSVPYGLIEGTPWFVYFSMDQNNNIRWDRIGKTPADLEQNKLLAQAIAETIDQQEETK